MRGHTFGFEVRMDVTLRRPVPHGLRLLRNDTLLDFLRQPGLFLRPLDLFLLRLRQLRYVTTLSFPRTQWTNVITPRKNWALVNMMHLY